MSTGKPTNQTACNFLVYATNAGLIDDPTNDTVSVINTGTNIVVDTITVGNAPLEVTVSQMELVLMLLIFF